MAPSTFTTIVMIVFAAFVLTWAGYTWFGSWQPEPRRLRTPAERDYQAAVGAMRRAIEAYERGERTLEDRDPA